MKFKRRQKPTKYTGIHIHIGGKSIQQTKTEISIQTRKLGLQRQGVSMKRVLLGC